VVGNIMAFGLYISGVQKIGPQKAILYSFAEPITAAIISTLVLGTAFTGFEALGFALIFIMLWLTTVDTRSPRRPIKAKVKQA
nr:DMT family transporter [Lachnospiraceae bacterium]